jgi:hypothetical protein
MVIGKHVGHQVGGPVSYYGGLMREEVKVGWLSRLLLLVNRLLYCLAVRKAQVFPGK